MTTNEIKIGTDTYSDIDYYVNSNGQVLSTNGISDLVDLNTSVYDWVLKVLEGKKKTMRWTEHGQGIVDEVRNDFDA